jgi:hypothetical protein
MRGSTTDDYPKGHLATLHAMLLQHGLLVFDIGFNRIPRASFQRALVRNGRKAIAGEDSVGKPAKLDVLFCRDPIAEAVTRRTTRCPAGL